MLKRKGLLQILFGILGLFLVYLFNSYQTSDKQYVSFDFEEFLQSEKAELKSHLELLEYAYSNQVLFQNTESFQKLFAEKSISLFVVKDDQLYFWSEEESPLNLSYLLTSEDFIRTPNSLHYKIEVITENARLFAVRQIARRYPYHNSYLQTEVSKAWKTSIHELTDIADWNLNSDQEQDRIFKRLVLGALFILSLIFLFYWIPTYLKLNLLQSSTITIFLILLTRGIIYFIDPLSWAELPLFDPVEFSISLWVKSTGDLLLNSLCIFSISYLLLRNRSSVYALFISLISFILYLCLTYFSILLIQGGVSNSQFSLELENLFKLELSSFIVIFSFGLLWTTSILWLKTSIRLVPERKEAVSYLTPIILLMVGFTAIIPSDLQVICLSYVLVLSIVFFIHRYQMNIPDLVFILFILLGFSAITARLIDIELNERESSDRQILLQKLAEEKDPLLEYLFLNVQEEIRNDDSLLQYLENRWDKKGGYENYLRNQYLKGYWDRYRISFTLCSDQDSILIGGSNLNQGCFDYFEDRIYREGDQISSINLFQLSNLAGRIDYIADIQLNAESNYRLFLELSRDYFSEDLGYPELFLNEEDKDVRLKLEDYSYAVYFQDELINSEGEYVYKLSFPQYNASSPNFYSYETSSYQHTILRKNENINIVLSKKKTSLFSILSRVTYLLVIYGFLFLIFSLLLPEFPFYHPLILTDFSTKIRLLIAGTLLMALVLFMLGTTYYIKEQYEAKNSKAIEEKLRSIGLELDQKVGSFDTLNSPLKPYVTSILIKFSNVFYTDINLYDSKGVLYASSRPELFNQNLKSVRMNPMAYSSVVSLNQSKLVQEEHIGKLGYLSAYVPFKNRQNELLAYLNLPYFAKQEELEEEISAFLAPTINSYVIIFTLALLISFLLINQLSRPLLLIRKHISSLKFGNKTELINWQSDDEIGELVKEYNRIAIELGESAEELAKSEREIAWREMAKQIAHEIKNPLTPMKLSIQHLQRSSEDQGVDLKEKIKRTCDTLIRQIDSLTGIAEAFSSFAKFPEKDFQLFQILPIVQEVSHLYIDQAEIAIQIDSKDRNVEVRADKDLVLRVFNNLIKNAIQAHDKEGLPSIQIQFSEDLQTPNLLKVAIQDFGKGINKEQSKYIFEPSFTTKSSGAGLGLAIVKRSMEQIGGSVSMNSEEGVGSVFTLYFPKA